MFAEDRRNVGIGNEVAGGNYLGVRRLYIADTDFRKFDFLEVVNPLRTKR